MIQRIQTVYLFVAFIASTLLFFNVPVAIFHLDNIDHIIHFNLISKSLIPEMTQEYYTGISSLPLIIINAIVIGLTFASILLYSKRILQLRLTMFAFLADVIFILVMFFTTDSIQKHLNTQNPATYKLGAILPLVTLVLLILASKAIRRDEKLVKGTDRLR